MVLGILHTVFVYLTSVCRASQQWAIWPPLTPDLNPYDFLVGFRERETVPKEARKSHGPDSHDSAIVQGDFRRRVAVSLKTLDHVCRKLLNKMVVTLNMCFVKTYLKKFRVSICKLCRLHSMLQLIIFGAFPCACLHFVRHLVDAIKCSVC